MRGHVKRSRGSVGSVRGLRLAGLGAAAGLLVLGLALPGFIGPASMSSAHAAAKTGQAAPAFEIKDSHGKTHKLSDYKGKYVVLEWVRHECPFVVKHYESGNMQALQKKYRGKGVVWLSVNSSAKGKSGYHSAKDTNAQAKEKGSKADAILLDPSGEMGRSYGAQATPHMFVVDPKGKVIYAGAIDDQPNTDKSTIKGATNYVSLALDAALAGKPVKKTATKAYGCSVKYAD